MPEYAANLKLGARLYTIGHTYVLPLLLLGFLKATSGGQSHWLPVIWIAHIGFDRLAGYVLKYETAFKDTHLQRV